MYWRETVKKNPKAFSLILIIKLETIEKDTSPLICSNYRYLGSEAVQTFPKHRFIIVTLGSSLSRRTPFFVSLLEVLTRVPHAGVFAIK